ncbi:carbohydrate ABC transporter membrane protein 2 (CUT1 family) [Neobacillus bataviensis]|jgi:multiple sugar transport system permease protein|uniref:Carbohydrate ABC transporter membrane protein 2 (CUT1 family) n=1 Tax=Neobacillus bataviensis TaxID=220685 RepID=A0A561CB28_9BACI|nr:MULTISPECIES: carbohydrate ABC transporter permease [Bacillaceae]PFO06272.1 ABC transporter permease [Bacillus sp. AFS076308]PGV53870.1 ABC transporter permease [Bacillus sp. AFS037270]TWD88274.1 carbohydrate ABC transporter membrane protein 2 (CUT1 family) [Neobacillus bataviensis]
MRIKSVKWWTYHILVGGFAVLMLYPVIWLLMSSFKESNAIFVTAKSLIPDPFILDNFAEGWKGIGGNSFGVFIKNTAVLVIVTLIGQVISSSLIAFGFARLEFKGKALWFGLMMVTLMLPYEVVMVPQYIIFSKLGWLNSIKPIAIPAYFGHPFFIFLLVQFIRTIPRELDEAATIDGCNTFNIFYKIILPLIKPALATAAIFSFYWTWDSLLGPVLYLNSPAKYTVSMALNMFLSNETVSNWGAMFAMSVVTLVPVFVIFFIFQRYVVEGISTSGLKG